MAVCGFQQPGTTIAICRRTATAAARPSPPMSPGRRAAAIRPTTGHGAARPAGGTPAARGAVRREARRAASARALGLRPRMLLLDEPTNPLTCRHRMAGNELAELRRRPADISHDRAFLRRLTAATCGSIGTGARARRGLCRLDLAATIIERRKAAHKLIAGSLTKTHLMRRGSPRGQANEGRCGAGRPAPSSGRIAPPARPPGVAAPRAGELDRGAALAKAFAVPTAPHYHPDFSTRILRGDRIGIIGETALARRRCSPLTGTFRRIPRLRSHGRLHRLYFDQRRPA